MDRKKIPAILMLTAAAATSLIIYARGEGLKKMLISLLAVMVAFYFIGTIIKMILDANDKKLNKVSDEGEVIEKENIEEEADRKENE